MIDTGYGVWSPLVWTATFLVLSFLVLLVFGLVGNSSYKRSSEQTKPFLSGNREAKKLHVGGSHTYWGFFNALKFFYDPLTEWHNGLVSDYIAWFVIVLAIIMIGVMF